MARRLSQRLLIEGALKTQTPLHVGGFGGGEDMPLARDGQGRWLVPGTSLAGPLRAWCSQAFGESLAGEFWGPQLSEGDKEVGSASYAIVEDGPIDLPKGASVEVRDGVGIDRHTGSAARMIKYDRAVIPQGSTFPLRMEIEIPATSDSHRIQAMLGHLLNALENEKIPIGADRTRGLGRVKLQSNSSVKILPLDNPDILDFLAGSTPKDWSRRQIINSCPDVQPQEPAKLTVQIEWKPRGPLMVKAESTGEDAQILPLVSGVGEKLALTLPGSSIKGALRSQAERIVRTVKGLEADGESKSRTRFHNDLDLPLVQEVFGSRGGKDQESHLGVGALAVADCYAKSTISRANWANIVAPGSRTDADDETARPLAQRLSDAKIGSWRETVHVAIDRWTGSAADGCLYNVLEPRKTSWSAIELELDFSRLDRHGLRKEGLALVLLTLRDLAEGRVPLGYATQRGMGETEILAIQINGQGLTDPEWAGLKDCRLEGGRIHRFPPALLGTLNEAWSRWTRQPADRGASESRRARS